MKIPNSVRIGGVDYAVVSEPTVRSGNQILYGKIEFNNCTIILSDTDNPNHQHKCITLWHEILHGIAEHANLKMPEDSEESIIDTLAKGIYQVLQDNGRDFFDIVPLKQEDAE